MENVVNTSETLKTLTREWFQSVSYLELRPSNTPGNVAFEAGLYKEEIADSLKKFKDKNHISTNTVIAHLFANALECIDSIHRHQGLMVLSFESSAEHQQSLRQGLNKDIAELQLINMLIDLIR